MIYKNPVLSGFYPDPSVCFANGKYYMVCSSFQYFPGVPLFESDNLVNWKQTGYVLTRKSQVQLEGVNSSGGVFAPTIRYNNGRFYMVTTNDTTHENFYVCTDDIYGEWSEPVTVDQGGIDPSLYFENGRTFFISNGVDGYGKSGVIQCEINIETGEKLSESRCIWQGSGGRYLESPHVYKIGEYYYLMAAEGGTEYGHMITLARSHDIWGEYESCPENPIVTNRNKAPYIIQGIGHGDLIQDKNGGWHILCLGFRQIHMWMTYHNLGREVFLLPVTFTDDGWFYGGNDKTADECYEINGDFTQNTLPVYTFKNTSPSVDWCYMRHPDYEKYELTDECYTLYGTDKTLDDIASPTFIALRQREFCFTLETDISIDCGEAGVTMYMCESEHYEVAIRKSDSGYEGVLKLNIGDIKHIQKVIPLENNTASLKVTADNLNYNFYINGIHLGFASTKYLSSEVSGGFTGTMTGLYATGNNKAVFTGFKCEYK